MVGEEVVEYNSENNDLLQGAGKSGPLTAKGNFEPSPHLPPLPFDIAAARRFIYAERRAVGAHTKLGRRHSKFGEQMENFVKAETPEQAARLATDIVITFREIKRLSRVRIAAPSLAIPKGDPL
jgi:hypothetical protein